MYQQYRLKEAKPSSCTGYRVAARIESSAAPPGIAASDYHLFRLMHHCCVDARYGNAEEMRKWVDDWIAAKPISNKSCRK